MTTDSLIASIGSTSDWSASIIKKIIGWSGSMTRPIIMVSAENRIGGYTGASSGRSVKSIIGLKTATIANTIAGGELTGLTRSLGPPVRPAALTQSAGLYWLALLK